MIRLWLCLSLVLFAPVGGVLSAAPSAEVCTQRCADDDARGQCAPDCADCACCAHVVRPLALAVTPVLLWSEPELERAEGEQARPATSDPGDILHVPIVLLA